MFSVFREWACDECGKIAVEESKVESLERDAPIKLPDLWAIYIDKETTKLKCPDCRIKEKQNPKN